MSHLARAPEPGSTLPLAAPPLRRCLAVLALCLGGAVPDRSEAVPQDLAPLLLISLDGFRWDYCALHPDATPHLRALAASGVSAASLIPVYPSTTFPNHYSIVTGLYPAHHGIVNNVFFDPALGEYFHFNRAVSSTDSRWWGGEPIWVTAERQGVRSASYFWVGSEAAIEGIRPTYWKHFDYTIPFYRRLDELTGWLVGPPAKRPRLITFYFSEVDSTGHKFGPDAPETVDAMRLLDRETGRLIERVALESRRPNVIVVSDHGMTALSPQRVLFLDDYVNMKDVQDDFDGPGVGLRPLRGTPQELVARFAKAPHAHAMVAEDLPARFHLSGNARIPPVWILLDSGWFMETHAKFNARWGGLIKADHGYDPQDPDMHGLLIANGPSFHSDGRVVPEVENIHIYDLMCALLGIRPAPNDGDDRLVHSMLAAH